MQVVVAGGVSLSAFADFFLITFLLICAMQADFSLHIYKLILY
jgi:hypothetical protein